MICLLLMACLKAVPGESLIKTVRKTNWELDVVQSAAAEIKEGVLVLLK